MNKKPVKNLKIIVDVDMEGISGIDDPSQIWGDQKGFEKSRSLMTKEVNAVVRGLKAGGATEVRVVDDHMSGGPSPLNIIPERLEKGAKLYQGPDFLGRLNEALDGSLAAAVLLGYHATADDKEGFLTHTIHPFNIAQIEINGKAVGETALAALKLAEHGIPVIMVTGDQALIREASELLPGIETVQVKTSLNRRTTKCLDPAEARKLIEKAAKRAISKIDQLKPLGIQPPYNVRIFFPTKEHAEIAAIIPGARRSGETAVSYVGKNFDEAEAFINTEIALTTNILLRKFIRELAKLGSFSRIEEKFWEKTRADWLSQ